jgi:hypothetical protein
MKVRNFVEETLFEVERYRSFLESNINTFSPDAFHGLGISVIRNLLDRHEVELARDSWLVSSGSGEDTRKLRFNPVENLDLPEELLVISRHRNILTIMRQIFGPDVGIFKRRVVAKDGSFSGSIFLHQDSGYQRGTLDKLSLFIALTDIQINSGGLEFWLGTNKFGYLDDAGEISRHALPLNWPIYKPTLSIGDAVLMDSRVWHGSDENRSGLPRIMTDFIYQRADCPSSIEVVDKDGQWSETISPILFSSPTLFSRSRVSKINELTAALKEIKSDK